MKKIILTTLGIAFLISCTQTKNQEQKLEQLDKNDAREVVLSSINKGDTILHITKQKIWNNNQLVAEKIDTIISKNNNTAVPDSLKTNTPIYVTIQ